jgi:hypothetical protein
VEWLEDAVNAQSRERILSVLEDVREITRHAKRRENGTFRVKNQREFDSVVASLHLQLNEYQDVVPGVQWLGQSDWKFGQRYLPPPRVHDARTGLSEMTAVEREFPAVQRILDLANAGLLEHLRQCRHCDKWFYAGPPKQVFCSEPCRVRHFQCDEDYKKRKRAYAKKRYEDEKEELRKKRERFERENRLWRERKRG